MSGDFSSRKTPFERTRERYHQTSITQIESYVAQVTTKYCYSANIRKQYDLAWYEIF